MNIVLAASEAFPFCKTGGLADVVGALTQDFSRVKGAKAVLFLPHYRNIKKTSSLKSVPGSFWVPVGTRLESAKISYLKWGNALVFFIENAKYFDRAELYFDKNGDYGDNDERFIFYSRAVLEACKFIGLRPDIIHAHDWQAGLIPAYLSTVYKTDAFFTKTRCMYTLHNIAYQGYYPKDTFLKAGFYPADFTSDKFEYWGGISYLKAGIVFADMVNTVSPTYAKELLNGQNSFGMEGVLRGRGKDFLGIINGIDLDVWDPQADNLIAMGYDDEFLRGKTVNKTALQEETGLAKEEDTPLVGMVSRLAYQKGVDLVANIIEQFAGRAQFVVQGKGDPKAEEVFRRLAYLYPKTLVFKPELDETLAHKIYAASDIFLMPSRFEPCGLSQMIAMRYGAPPVVAQTGGLLDTVKPYGGPSSAEATGFYMDTLDAQGLAGALERALLAYEDKKTWRALIANAMAGNFSWENSSKQYIKCFNDIIKRGPKW
ncbi:MAG: glycogen synthase [Elusimicrobiota bacterium]|jgi:starch synthase|nr:glycogen synthase [Elusimicrobiota bacterium]